MPCELPPIGHDLTYPRNAKAIATLGERYKKVKALLAPQLGDTEEMITRIRTAAHEQNCSDLFAFTTFLTAAKLRNSSLSNQSFEDTFKTYTNYLTALKKNPTP